MPWRATTARCRGGVASSVLVRRRRRRIPGSAQKFTPYFAANIPTWDVIPTDAQYGDILQWVAGWSVDDQESGYLTEPKKIALAICGEP
ncbi:hypothetical protein GCM10027089_31860 [Nocardia thraciensis]